MRSIRSIRAARVTPTQPSTEVAPRPNRGPFASRPRQAQTWIGLTVAAIAMACIGYPLSGIGFGQPPEPASATQELEQQQKQVAIQYSKLEEMFIRMSELEATSNPTRAGLLMQAAQLSKQLATQQRMAQASDLLGKGQFSRAIPELESSRENLKKLLELLQSENRSTRIKDERKRLEDILKDVRRIENIQRATRGRTESGQDRQAAADDQRDLEQQLAQSESDLKPEEPSGDAAKSEPNPSDGKKENGQDSQSKKDEAESNRSDAKEPNASEASDESPKKDPSTSDPLRSPNSDSKPSPDGLKSSSETSKPMPNDASRPGEPRTEGEKSEGEKAAGAKADGANSKDPRGDSKPEGAEDGKEDKDASSDKPNPDASASPEDSKPEKTPPGGKQQLEGNKNSNEKSNDPKSQNPESQPQDSNPSDESEQDSEAEDSESQASDGKPASREEQARKRVQRARQRMKKAENKLREDKRSDAVQEQQKAEEELQKAIAELERILTQLREEEIERALVDLETRLKRMYEWEKSIRDQTDKLASLTGDDRDRQLEIQANKLSIEQMKVVMEGQRAMLLLQDEGSSQAFPEALEQVNRDAQSVVKRLVAADVSTSTQSIQDEILGALEEMIDALQQVQKKRDEEKQQQQQQGGGQSDGGGQQEQPLVDKLSELRLIKTLQLRVNRRTDRLADESNNSNDLIGDVGDPRLREELLELSTRQQKIQDVTREILLEKAKQ